MDFAKLNADDVMLARRGQIAAREGAPLDRTQPEAWQWGWLLNAETVTVRKVHREDALELELV